MSESQINVLQKSRNALVWCRSAHISPPPPLHNDQLTKITREALYEIEADPRIRGLPRPEKIRKIKEINGS
jgi:hypothetical protein